MMTVKINDKFVCSWGYDQTQISVYNVAGVKGKTVIVEGMNSWSGISDDDLCAGSQVKVYTFKRWDQLTDDERADFERRNFDRWSYEHHLSKETEEKTPVRTITKMSRINGERWSYIWELDNGETVNSKESYKNNQTIRIIKGLKKCILKDGYNGIPQIRIDQSICAHLDPNYNINKEKYAEQNEYTAYNGR